MRRLKDKNASEQMIKTLTVFAWAVVVVIVIVLLWEYTIFNIVIPLLNGTYEL